MGGRYRLQELVGIGGMSRVFRATDELLGRTVAVKLFPAAAGNHTDRARLDAETRLLASLSHPSLLTLYDADAFADGSGFLAMEYVDGGTLGDLLEKGPLAPREVAHVAVDLGDALAAVHAAGVIHRDIKPPNVLMRTSHGRRFQATLADFGIAYLMDSARLTTPGMAVGTAAYFSPEQARGAQPTPASDIYALGLVLIESLTGRRAFPQSTPIEAAIARLHTPPEVPAGFGYGWRSLLTAMTATDPADRPSAAEVADRAARLVEADIEVQATQAELAIAFTAAPTPAPVPAPSLTPAPEIAAGHSTQVLPTVELTSRRHTRAARRARRRPVAAMLVGGAAAVLIAGGVWAAAADASVSPVSRIVAPVVGEDTAETTVEPAVDQPAEQQTAVVEPVAPAVQQPAVQAPAAKDDKGGHGVSGRGEDASSGSQTHGNGTPGNGKGKGSGSGSGKSDRGHGGG